MADLSVQPIGTQVKPVQGMSLGEIVNFVRGAQQYKAEKQLLPEQIEQTKVKTLADQQSLAQSRMRAIADSQISLINDPLILQAEQDPNRVDKTKLIELIESRGRTLGKNLGIPEEQVTGLLSPYLDLATKDPSQVRTFLKQRHIEGLDQAARTPVLTGTLTGVKTGAGETFIQSGEFAPEKRGAPVLFAPKTLEPGSQIVQGPTDAAGNPTYNILDSRGNVVQTGVLPEQLPAFQRELEPSGGAVQRVEPPSVGAVSTPVTNIPKGRAITAPIGSGLGPNDYKTLQEQVTTTKGSLTNAENALKDIRNVETYLDAAMTGVGSERLNKALSALGLAGLSSAEQKAAAREIVNKSLASLVMHQNASGNGKFAADLAQTQNAVATVAQTDPAIRKVIGDIQVLMQHQKDYTLGMDKLIQKYPEHGAFNKALFDTAMNQAYELRAIQMNNIKNDKKLTDAQKKQKFNDYLEKNNIGFEEGNELYNKSKFYNDLINGDVEIVNGKLVSKARK
jgi:hypothetical protein